MDKTHWKKTMNPNYMGTFSFDPGKDKILTIDHVLKDVEVVGEDGKPERKTVVYWKEKELPWILNVTNCKTITKLSGSPYIEDWAGLRIQLFIDNKVKAFGTITDGIRVRNKAPEDAQIACEECGQFISPAFSMSATQMAAYTKKKYGKNLCAECAQEQKKGEENNGTEQQ